eukprot:TRINITY_DN53188_c0_g1_i1.p1 TRINITY_DN53188_c0_g1~~TRINITY_DN53188_c0_g1_i1.p1  ORF type:complete len:491 (+),score=104.43 TRINITY_DN53188_c0_g1_i1:63-1535(+)
MSAAASSAARKLGRAAVAWADGLAGWARSSRERLRSLSHAYPRLAAAAWLGRLSWKAIAKKSAVAATPFGVASGARYWRSYQTLDDHDLSWPHDSCVISSEEVLELAERSALFKAPDDAVSGHEQRERDLQNVRRWHMENGFVGGIVVRSLDDHGHSAGNSVAFQRRVSSRRGKQGAAADTSSPVAELPSQSDGSTAQAAQTMSEGDWEADLVYYVYYELSGHGELEQQIFLRGTSNREDVALDFEVKKAWDPETECYFHAGFLRRAQRVLADIEPLLQQNAVITLAGHSMGGAVATCIGAKLQKRGFTIRKVVSFGAPKLTTADAVPRLSRLPLLRVCHEDDFVVGLPHASLGEMASSSWKGVYHHVGPQLLLGSCTNEASFLGGESALQWWNHCFWFLLSPSMVTYHRMFTYVDRLKMLCDGETQVLPYNECHPRRRASCAPKCPVSEEKTRPDATATREEAAAVAQPLEAEGAATAPASGADVRAPE